MKKIHLRKGVLIAIEGTDGSGKSTQVKMLCDSFRQEGYNVRCLKEPTNGQYGQKIRLLAKNGRHLASAEEELELFLKDRIEDCTNNIRPALKRRELIFIDRYYFSTIAYQGALGLDPVMIWNRNEEIAVVPDLVILLDVPVQTGLSRILSFRKEQHDHFENEKFLEGVRKLFLNIKELQKLRKTGRHQKSPKIIVIDGRQDPTKVFHRIYGLVKDFLSPFILAEKK